MPEAAAQEERDRSAEVLGRLFDVRGLRVVVTGAASGLGFAMAEVLADCGARVTLADIDVDLLEEVTGSLAERGAQVRSAAVDVSDAGQVQALIDDVVAAEGGVDVVFANAGHRVDARASPSTAGSRSTRSRARTGTRCSAST